MQPERGIDKKEPSGLFFSVRVPIFRNVYRGCCCLGANVQRIFYLTRTGIEQGGGAQRRKQSAQWAVA